ncbi:hypothetical protein CAPTEDRAFT_198890 [Capitella teleta]|uniref:EamA domain-containing protein n=1 Tax=Capitella teleta TaxID=283909 RepID=R7U6A0_CAPTE|nr:hypothetical protein CAPTEDRAFT_198890 [Capitella teleta]|eukprot:ELU01641.1 hypothetical protein CAPTEDRAFT_198890 [Capitella teleta]
MEPSSSSKGLNPSRDPANPEVSRAGEASSCLQQIADDPEPLEPPQHCCKCKVPRQICKLFAGIGLMLVGSVCWAGVTQSAHITNEHSHFDCPLFLVYFSTSWFICVYPLYLILKLMSTRGKLEIGESFREGVRAFGDDGFSACPYKIFAKCAGLTILWDMTAYLFVRSLDFKAATDIVALFATNSSFVYLLSWIVLQKKFIAIRIVAFILGMTGTICLIYIEKGSANSNMWGAILVIISTAGAAFYRVLFRKIIGDIPSGQLAFTTSCLGLFNVVSVWPMLLLLHFTGAEKIQWATMPWGWVSTTAAFMMGCKLVLTFGSAFTYPILLYSTFIFALPFCFASTLIVPPYKISTLSGVQIGSYVLIVTSFLLNILPDDWHGKILKKLNIKQRIETPDDSRLAPRLRMGH